MKTVTFALSLTMLTLMQGDAGVPAKNNTGSVIITKTKVAAQFTTFRIHRKGTNIAMRWSVDLPGDVVSFTVQRSYDGEFYDDIASVPASSASFFSYEDIDPFPGVIFYRIVANNTDLSATISAVETIRIISRN